jgi:hypothetical protein
VAKFTEMKKEENHAEIKISNLLFCSFLDRVPKTSCFGMSLSLKDQYWVLFGGHTKKENVNLGLII